MCTNIPYTNLRRSDRAGLEHDETTEQLDIPGANSSNNNEERILEEVKVLEVLLGTDKLAHSIPVPQMTVILNKDGLKCHFTKDISRFNRSHVLLLTVVNIQSVDDLPSYRPAGQRWVGYTRESPFHTETKFADQIYNHSMTYSPHADISVPYGECTRLVKSNPHYKDGTNFAAGKKHLAAWFVSNCIGQSGRLDYVRVLQEYIPVHIYGKCGDHECPEDADECDQMLKENYKFYLALENSLCRWYLTEKVFRAYESQVVPVVMGALDYTEHLPKGSYLHVADYDSPRALARHMMELSANDTLYNEMFSWRKHYRCASTGSGAIARRLCEFLHKTKNGGPYIQSFSKHWNETEQCITKYQYGKRLGVYKRLDVYNELPIEP